MVRNVNAGVGGCKGGRVMGDRESLRVLVIHRAQRLARGLCQ